MAGCPVDHSSSLRCAKSSSCSSESQTAATASEKCPIDHSQLAPASETDKCPFDHKARSIWTGLGGLFASSSPNGTASASGTPLPQPGGLPIRREVSSIPRADAEGENWVYPSEAQFFAAMARKQYNPRATDMRVVVPMHNAVNERVWNEVLLWEKGRGGEKCGGVKLVSFKGRPNDRTPRAWVKTFLGYRAPFDRHDWVVDRCGTRTRYVIDFYAGKGTSTGNVSFYLDVRPALDTWEAIQMRTSRFIKRWVGPLRWRNVAANDLPRKTQ